MVWVIPLIIFLGRKVEPRIHLEEKIDDATFPEMAMLGVRTIDVSNIFLDSHEDRKATSGHGGSKSWAASSWLWDNAL